MSNLKIQLRPDLRVLFLGTTGFGKTVLAKFFLSKMNRVLAIDPKHTLKIDGYTRAKGLPMFDKNFRVILRPKETDDLLMSRLFRQLFKAKNCTIYIDELSTLAEMFPIATRTLADIARTGRERNVAVWMSLQRPRWVPLIFITEAEIVFQFNLRSGKDREYLAEFVGDEVKDRVEYFQFWYTHPAQENPVLMTLDTQKNVIMTV